VFDRLVRSLVRPPPGEVGVSHEDSTESTPASRLRRLLVRWLPVLLVLGGCVYLGASLDLHGLWANLLAVRAPPLGIAILFAWLGVVARAAYWRTLLEPAARVPLRTMTDYTFASVAASVLLPFRGGEALRVWLLRRHHGVPIALSGAIIALERVGDVLALLVLVAPLPWLIPDLPPTVGRALRLLPLAALGLLAVVALASRGRVWIRWLSGFKIVESPRLIAKGFAFLLLAWVFEVNALLTVLWALRIAPTLGMALVVLLLVNVAVAIPAAPGQVGSHELGSTLALKLLGVPTSQAVAFALVFHATQLFTALSFGLHSARVLSRLEVPPRVEPLGSG
jgi:uncharacterized membrane protein YbhN (UPF0104 family)